VRGPHPRFRAPRPRIARAAAQHAEALGNRLIELIVKALALQALSVGSIEHNRCSQRRGRREASIDDLALDSSKRPALP
jgi:hypothetical protein